MKTKQKLQKLQPSTMPGLLDIGPRADGKILALDGWYDPNTPEAVARRELSEQLTKELNEKYKKILFGKPTHRAEGKE